MQLVKKRFAILKGAISTGNLHESIDQKKVQFVVSINLIRKHNWPLYDTHALV